ncbi:MAG TPA: thioredoxin family protein [Bacteroidales bacterium]|nr:thioredoxin family protein [Bacteroidales bacterium]
MKSLVKPLISLVIWFIAFGSFSPVSAQDPLKPYRDDQNIRAEVNKAVAVAGREHRHVLIQFGGNWCPWCLRFHQLTRTVPTIDSLLKADYVYMLANVPQDKKKRDYSLFAEYGYPNRFGYPVFVILNGEGKVLHIQDSGVLEHCRDKGYDTARVVNFLKMWNPKAVDPATYK